MKRTQQYRPTFINTFLLILSFVLSTNLGEAQFGPINFLTESAYLGDFDLADFDNDGDLDVVMGASIYVDTPNKRPLVWYENENNLWIPHAFGTNDNNSSISQLIARDFDNDGWIDLVTCKDGANSIKSYFYKNEGISGNVVFTKTPLEFIDGQKKMLAGDINGDGYEDLVVANELKLSSVLNQGINTSFSNNSYIDNYENLDFAYVDIELEDIDLDGDLDIVAAAQEGEYPDYYRSLFWYKNEDGLGNFSERILIEYEMNCGDYVDNPLCSYDIEIADFNADGLPDIFYQKEGGKIYYQEVSQEFSNPIALEYDLGLDRFMEYKAVDMDQDGDMDIVRCGISSGQLVWIRNMDNNGAFEQVLNGGFDIKLDYQTSGIIADLEGDGDLDCIFHRGGYGTSLEGVFAFQNEGTGDVFNNPVQISDNINGDYQMFDIDMDEDGDQDLIYLAEKEGDIYWQENLGNNQEFSSPIPLFHDNNIKYFDHGDLDGDGDLDIAISWRDNTSAELYFYEKLDNSPTFGPKTLVHSSNAYYKNLHLGDMDADGDLDMVYTFWNNLTWLENQGGLNFSNTHTFLIEGDLIGLANFDGNNFSDLYYTNENDRTAVLIRESLNPGSTTILSDSTEIFSSKIVDIDDDGDDDLVAYKRDFSISYEIFLYHNENGIFSQHLLAENDNPISVEDVLDIDGDGKKDILYKYGWFRQQSNIFDYGHIEFDLQSIPGNIAHTANLDGVGPKDFIFRYAQHSLLWCSNQLASGYLTEGKVFIDYNETCTFETTQDTSLYGWIVQFEKGNQIYSTSTSPFGNYSGYLPDSGDYVVNVVRPSIYWAPCVEDTTIMVLDTSEVYIIDFPIILEQECPLLGLDIGSTRLRPCIPGMVTYSYCNYGTVTADAAQLEIQIPDWVLLDSTNIPWSSTTDSSYIFDLGDIPVLDCAQINVYVTPDCEESEIGDVACFEGYITPDEICISLDSLWDGSTIEANAICNNDSITFKLQNIGNGDMEESRQFRIEYIVNDDIVMLFLVDTFQLETDEIKEITIASDEGAFRLEADQDDEHPLVNIASVLINSCQEMSSENSEDLINNFPNYDGNPFSETYCRTLTGSFDPNLKEAFPQGQYGTYIDNDWELEYNIHFQNTGNDTAFTVVIEDQLSTYFDLSTLKIGAASHSFTWDLNFDRSLIFTFDHILLPDSTTNLLHSQGFVQFFIQLKPDLPVLTNIDNHAAIFFDANDPILTDNVRRITRKPVTTESQNFQYCEGDFFNDIQVFSDTLIIDTLENNLTGCHLTFNNISVSQTMFFIDSLVNPGDIINGQVITQDTVFITNGTNDLGCETTTYFQISVPTNVNQLEKSKTINVFPNPASDQIYVDWQDAVDNNAFFEIRNINGQFIKTGRLNNPIINTSDLPAGLYILQVKSNEQLGLARLIIL